MGRYIPNAFNLFVVMYVNLGSTACSYGLAILGSTIGQPFSYTSLKLAPQGEPAYDRIANLIAAFNGVSSAGAGFSALFNSWLADALSRKHTIQVGAAILSTGAALCAGSVNNGMFIFARLLTGFGTGILFSCVPMYKAEVSTPETRGFMVSMHGVMFKCGYVLSSWIGFGVYFISTSESTSSFSWRFPLAFQAAPALILLLRSVWLPQSPRWLMQKSCFEEAEQVLSRSHSRKGEEHQDQTNRQYYQMKKQLE